MILIRLYIHIGFSKKILSYYFINLYYIFNWLNSEPKKFINLACLLIYRVLVYRVSTVWYELPHMATQFWIKSQTYLKRKKKTKKITCSQRQ